MQKINDYFDSIAEVNNYALSLVQFPKLSTGFSPSPTEHSVNRDKQSFLVDIYIHENKVDRWITEGLLDKFGRRAHLLEKFLFQSTDWLGDNQTHAFYCVAVMCVCMVISGPLGLNTWSAVLRIACRPAVLTPAAVKSPIAVDWQTRVLAAKADCLYVFECARAIMWLCCVLASYCRMHE